MAEYGQFSENTTVTREHVYDVLHNTEHLYKDVKSEEANCYDYIENKTLLKEENTDNKKDLDIYENIKEEVKKYGQDTQNFINFKIENGGKTEKCEDINLIPTIKKEENIDPTVLIPSSDSSPVDVTLYNEDSEESCKQGGNSGSDNRSTNILQCGLYNTTDSIEVKTDVPECNLCGTQFDTNVNNGIKLTLFDKELTICNHCYGFFYTHLMVYNKSVKCVICNVKFTNELELNIHLQYHKYIKEFKCHECKKSFPSEAYLFAHSLSKHSAHKHICSACQKPFKYNYELFGHLMSYHGAKKYICWVCQKSFKCKHEFSSHFLTHEVTDYDVNNGFRNNIRNAWFMKFNIKKSVVINAPKYVNNKGTTCSTCCETFLSKRELVIHSLKVHNANVPTYLNRK